MLLCKRICYFIKPVLTFKTWLRVREIGHQNTEFRLLVNKMYSRPFPKLWFLDIDIGTFMKPGEIEMLPFTG